MRRCLWSLDLKANHLYITLVVRVSVYLLRACVRMYVFCPAAFFVGLVLLFWLLAAFRREYARVHMFVLCY